MQKKEWLTIAVLMVFPGILLTTSCAKKAVQTQPVAATEPEVQDMSESQTEKEATAPPGDEVRQGGGLGQDRRREEWDGRQDAERAFLKEVVHFGFDSYELSEEARQILMDKADYLRANPNIAITVEGHCDDRGTDVYNLALGQRRAESVRRFMSSLGVDTKRLHIISYGEERPIAREHSEASWEKNRRAQFVIN